MKKNSFVFFLLLSLAQAYGQQFRAEAPLPDIEKDGFYRIAVGPELSVYLSEAFANLRIIDDSGKEVPYLLREEIPHRFTNEFKEYDMEIKRTPSCCTEVILKNPRRAAINNIRLLIRNADAFKVATLSGSDDKKDWFVIKEEFTMTPVDGGNGTTEMKVIDFPMSNYLFYAVHIADSTNAPIAILKAGHYVLRNEEGMFSPIPGKFAVITEKKRTLINLSFDTLRLIDRIDLQVHGSQPYFLRRALLRNIAREAPTKKKRRRTDVVEVFEVSSTHPIQIDLAPNRWKELQLEIQNDDNPPLEIVSLQAMQLNRNVVAWLLKGKKYAIKFGAAGLSAPSYDLHFFRDSISKQVPVIQAGKIVFVERKPSVNFFTSTRFIWAALAAVVVLVAFMAVRLTGEIQKSTRE